MQQREEQSAKARGAQDEAAYMTIQQVADHLGISRGVTWQLIMERGEIPYHRLSTRVIRVARADLDDYLARCRSDGSR